MQPVEEVFLSCSTVVRKISRSTLHLNNVVTSNVNTQPLEIKWSKQQFILNYWAPILCMKCQHCILWELTNLLFLSFCRYQVDTSNLLSRLNKCIFQLIAVHPSFSIQQISLFEISTYLLTTHISNTNQNPNGIIMNCQYFRSPENLHPEQQWVTLKTFKQDSPKKETNELQVEIGGKNPSKQTRSADFTFLQNKISNDSKILLVQSVVQVYEFCIRY